MKSPDRASVNFVFLLSKSRQRKAPTATFIEHFQVVVYIDVCSLQKPRPCVVIEDTYLLHVSNWEELPSGDIWRKKILSLDFKRWQNEDVTNAQWKTGSLFFSPLTSPGLYFLSPHLRLRAISKNFSFQNHGQQLASGLGARGSQTRGKHPTTQILTEYILGPVLLNDTGIPIILTFKNSISSSHQHS